MNTVLLTLLLATLPVNATFPLDTAHVCFAPKFVYLKIADETVNFRTCGVTANETAEEVNNAFEKYAPAMNMEVEAVHPEQIIENGELIPLTEVAVTNALSFSRINYNIEKTYTKSLPHRKVVVNQKGIYGSKARVTQTRLYPNGKKVTKVISSWIEKEPVIEKQTIGTKYDLKVKTIKGDIVHYWRTLTVTATSYDKNCYGCNEWTATGAYLKKGIIAVDPKVIPMHTTMYVPGYGFGKAEDTGGKVKGNKIDLAFDDVRYGNWSKRSVMIYIVD